MYRFAIIPLLILAVACTDISPLEPPTMETQLGLAPSGGPPSALEYTFQGARDWTCGETEGCFPGESRTTPSGVLHIRGFTARFFVTGQLVGDLWVMGDFNLNLRNGKGVANGNVRLNLTEPGVGSFECKVHADYVGYNEASGWAYVEHAKYFGCKGTGDFEGQQMVARLNNEANAGLALADGVAEIW